MVIVDFKSGVYKYARKAILVYGVPLSILSDQLNGRLLQ
jgi:hypothetical protein